MQDKKVIERKDIYYLYAKSCEDFVESLKESTEAKSISYPTQNSLYFLASFIYSIQCATVSEVMALASPSFGGAKAALPKKSQVRKV